jgi:hypothetical protein
MTDKEFSNLGRWESPQGHAATPTGSVFNGPAMREHLKLMIFVNSLLDPEQNGHAVSSFIRDEARKALGMEPCEFDSPNAEVSHRTPNLKRL